MVLRTSVVELLLIGRNHFLEFVFKFHRNAQMGVLGVTVRISSKIRLPHSMGMYYQVGYNYSTVVYILNMTTYIYTDNSSVPNLPTG